MRSISFLNGAGATLVLGDDTYNIESIDGLGIPDQNIQEQGGPGQDGTTYIDTTLRPREINVVVNVRKPNDYPAIDTCRRELVSKLNPKNGEGIITYTTEGGAQYKITGNPTVIFENKSYSEPFLRASIRFRCSDPYWRKTTDTTVTLEKTFNQPDNTMILDVEESACCIQQSDGLYRCAYIRRSDDFLVQRTSTDLKNWSSETTINGAVTTIVGISLIQQSNGVLRIAYRRNSDSFLVQRTSSDNGITWSSESVINNAASAYPCLIQQSNGTFRVAYLSAGTLNIVQKTSADGTTWSAQSTIVGGGTGANGITMIQCSDDTFLVSYAKNSNNYLYTIKSSDGSTWASESLIISGVVGRPVLFQDSNDEYFLMYNLSTVAAPFERKLKMKTSSDAITWSSEYKVNSTASHPESLFYSQDDKYVSVYVAGLNIMSRESDDGIDWGTQGDIASGSSVSVVRNQAGVFIAVYKRLSDSYLVKKESLDGTTWGSESVITANAINVVGAVNILIDNNGIYRVFYLTTTQKMKQKTSSDAITWSAELAIDDSITVGIDSISCIQSADGLFRISYINGSGHIIQLSSTNGLLWTTVGTITTDASNRTVLKQLSDGTYVCAYQISPSNSALIRTSADGVSWSNSITVSTSADPAAIYEKSSGDVFIFYIKSSNAHLAYKSSKTLLSWSGESTIVNSTVFGSASVLQEANGIIRVLFVAGPANGSTILQYLSSVPYTISDTGDIPVPCTIMVDGPAIGPRIDELVTGNYIKLTKTIANGDYAEIDTAFGNKRVTLVEGGITKNGSQYLDIGSTFFSIEPGSKVTISDDSASPLTATMTYTERYAGI